MSSIEWTPKPRVIWTDTNYLGLTEEWVAELVAEGYEFIDRRTNHMSKDRRTRYLDWNPDNGEQRRTAVLADRRDPEEDRRSNEQGGRRWDYERREGFDRRDPLIAKESLFASEHGERRRPLLVKRCRQSQRRDKHFIRRDPEGKSDRRGPPPQHKDLPI